MQRLGRVSAQRRDGGHSSEADAAPSKLNTFVGQADFSREDLSSFRVYRLADAAVTMTRVSVSSSEQCSAEFLKE